MGSFHAVETFVNWLFGGEDNESNRLQLEQADQKLQEMQEKDAEGRARHSAEEAAEHQRARRAAEEEAERVSRTAAEAAGITQTHQEEYKRAAAEAAEARHEVEHRWFEGVRPECHPPHKDVVWMKAEYHYSPGFFHLVVVGTSGCGKSSFINAVCGLSNNHDLDDSIVAHTEIIECTPNMPDWQYFNNLGLYIFDCIIMLFDNCFSESDLTILHTCKQFKNVEAFIVCSKSDQHINNMAVR
ncbi:hypothetical protein F4604DRAFT_1675928 [Suillus subluteus]|nr:hypothetical protein F4604DRAFT_1675928 [Suillus subluteus]